MDLIISDWAQRASAIFRSICCGVGTNSAASTTPFFVPFIVLIILFLTAKMRYLLTSPNRILQNGVVSLSNG